MLFGAGAERENACEFAAQLDLKRTLTRREYDCIDQRPDDFDRLITARGAGQAGGQVAHLLPVEFGQGGMDQRRRRALGGLNG